MDWLIPFLRWRYLSLVSSWDITWEASLPPLPFTFRSKFAAPTKIVSPSSSTNSQANRHGRPTPIRDILFISTGFCAYLTCLLLYFLAPRSWRHPVLFPLLLSPPGAMIRFAFARLNPSPRFIDRFPIGTFIVNILATLIISGSVAAQYSVKSSAQTSVLTCAALYGIQQGFCGCLSTVSTFVVELRSIKGKRWKWGYLFASVILGHICVLAIVGGVGWDIGYGMLCKG